MTTTSIYTEACLDAFINCNNLLSGLDGKSTGLPVRVKKIIEESAQICLGTFHAIKNHSVNVPGLALLCVGICEECAEVCERVESLAFQQCAQACRICSKCILDFAVQSEESL